MMPRMLLSIAEFVELGGNVNEVDDMAQVRGLCSSNELLLLRMRIAKWWCPSIATKKEKKKRGRLFAWTWVDIDSRRPERLCAGFPILGPRGHVLGAPQNVVRANDKGWRRLFH